MANRRVQHCGSLCGLEVKDPVSRVCLVMVVGEGVAFLTFSVP